MQKGKGSKVLDYIVKHSKFVFPVIVVVVVAFTVSVALNAGNARAEQDGLDSSEPPASEEVQAEELADAVIGDVPLAVNENEEIYSLILTYYNAMATGDSATLAAIYDQISENDLLYYENVTEYVDYYPLLEIYAKPGLHEGETVVYAYYKICFVNHEEHVPGCQAFYVCDDGEGELYLKNGKNFTQEEIDYVKTVTTQADVKELYNRINAEFYDLLEERPELVAYLYELDNQVSAAVGVALAQLNAPSEHSMEESEIPAAVEEGGSGDVSAQEPPVDVGPQYATATTTVNVRESDSERAEKLGKVSGGTRVQVQEVRVNGWTKVVYEGKDGYIKSQYLQMEESAAGMEVIGTVTATSAVNIRAAANENASRLGVLAIGETLDLLAREDGWCKVVYNGKVGYVKADYVQ